MVLQVSSGNLIQKEKAKGLSPAKCLPHHSEEPVKAISCKGK
jgi:hypothetical protein